MSSSLPLFAQQHLVATTIAFAAKTDEDVALLERINKARREASQACWMKFALISQEYWLEEIHPFLGISSGHFKNAIKTLQLLEEFEKLTTRRQQFFRARQLRPVFVKQVEQETLARMHQNSFEDANLLPPVTSKRDCRSATVGSDASVCLCMQRRLL